MAGQPRTRGTRAHGRTTRAASPWPVGAAVSAAVSGSLTDIPTASIPATDPRTRATYRMLLFRGLAPTEAANLTAYLCGIPVGEQGWSIDEVNQLLFLRELNRTGRFGAEDGTAA